MHSPFVQLQQTSDETLVRQLDANPQALRETEVDFIAARDCFFQASVNEAGWPYVQHRGGPAGFLKVLDAHTLAYADFSGNRQYLSRDNLQHNDRISMILIDFAHRRRLKLMGHATLIQAEEAPGLMTQLATPGYRARIERAVVIRVVAWDWNCPQHLTPRFTEAEVLSMLAARPRAEPAGTAE
ncbi:pyridoxamine 5'-phosphate oxidase family protein [Leeia oryzae]|uniref:pyridoxamine 5'-phosphate oxidase family protein n=1 Tax=Leeia oryzae TaxID=356662 RepID=UPI00037C6953|nr:pyridoxamine 5'-phosphate oxidase family protein [Leeia oryzae]